MRGLAQLRLEFGGGMLEGLETLTLLLDDGRGCPGGETGSISIVLPQLMDKNTLLSMDVAGK